MKASTHDGRFHADEIFALAVLNLFYPDLEIIRSRDENVYNNNDIIVDVGHVYEPDNLIFDHHQRSFSLKRESGIPYASFGLVWKHYGELLCGSSETSEYIDSLIVQAIDADDNGIDIYETKIDGIGFHTLSDIIESFVPRHVDDDDKVQKGKKFEYGKLLPAEWGGRQKDFAGISDVHDALYCHNGCFLAEAKSLEGADKLAGIALEN